MRNVDVNRCDMIAGRQHALVLEDADHHSQQKKETG